MLVGVSARAPSRLVRSMAARFAIARYAIEECMDDQIIGH